MKTTLFLCAFLVHSSASAASLSREGAVLPGRRVEAADSEIPKLLGPIDRMVKEAHALVVKGLEARTSSQSIAAFRHSERTCRAVLDRLDRIASEHSGDAALLDALDAIRSQARGEAVSAALDAGHVFLARADNQDALKEADKAVSIDPDDGAAQEFREATTLPSYGVLGVVPLQLRTLRPRPANELRVLSGAMRAGH